MITFHIISLFTDSFSYLNQSMLGRAIKRGKIKIKIYNLRDFANDKHKTTDDKPYGGGPGMVLKAEPIIKAVQKIKKNKKRVKIIALSADGDMFTNTHARTLAKNSTHIVLIAGHYEGVDARVAKILKAEKISVGQYIVTGGELPAMIVVDAVARQIPGVLGTLESIEEKRIASPEVYTRPEILVYKKKKYRVPKVLLSGNHKKIEEWRAKKYAR
ncbi:MAG: tRNA (guanosine(37)-N1)-methyltransferase TrmD [bacterium]|nr:tRNA (guanosine(37)-N1)-methyltransferase TrmD [bacterium]